MTHFMTQLSRTSLGAVALLLFGLATTANATVTAPSFGDLLIGLDGDNLTLSGSDVTTWNDQVANGGADDFVQDFNTPSTADPTLLPNVAMPNGTVHNVVGFTAGPIDYNAHTGSGQTLRLKLNPNMDNLTTQSWYMVVRFDDVSNTDQNCYGLSNYVAPLPPPPTNPTLRTKISTGLTSGNLGQMARDGGGNQDINTGTPTIAAVAGEWYILSGRLNMTSSVVNGMTEESHSFRVHDSSGLISSNTRINVDGLPVGPHYQSLLGNRGDGHWARFFDGAIAEFLFYDDILSSTPGNNEEGQVQDYLMDKYFNAQSSPDGDFNGDLVVDGADFLLWQQNPAVGDLADWQTNYGYGAAAAAVGAVPEPTSILLFGLGSLIVLGTRRVRRAA